MEPANKWTARFLQARSFAQCNRRFLPLAFLYERAALAQRGRPVRVQGRRGPPRGLRAS